jgi:hypothetical protein
MSVQSEHYLSLPGNLHIGIISDRELPLGEKQELLLGAYLPDVKVLDSSPSTVDMTLCHVESTEVSLATGSDEIEIHDTWSESFSKDLPHLLYSIARSLWLKRGYFPIHAACVGDTEFTLMPGHSGVGKTTTALEVVTQHGQKLLSGNTTLVQFGEADELRAIAGTKTMTLKLEDFEQGEYEAVRSLSYGNRIAFELPVDLQTSKPKDIGRIALVRLSNGLSEWSELSPLSALHTLYPYFLDTEHTDCIVGQGKAVYLGETPPYARSLLTDRLGRALANISLGTGMGSAQFLAEKLSTR